MHYKKPHVRNAVRPLRILCLASATLLAAGCAQFGDQEYITDAQKDTEDRPEWAYQQDGAEEVTYLTDLVRNPELIKLVIEGLNNNPSLKQTALALQIAYKQKTNSNADRLPNANLGFSGTGNDGGDSYSTEVTVSWEVDIWGKLNDAVLAADSDIATSAANLAAARDMLAANIMRSWLNLVLQYNRIEIETNRLAVLERNQSVIRERYRKGLGSLEDLDSARSIAAQSRSRLVGYKETLAQLERELKQLVGKQTIALPAIDQAELPTVIQPLAGLPAQTLAGRPDLQAAYHRIAAEQYRTSVAYKSLLPSLNLTGALRDTATNPSADLFSSSAWSLLGSITQPLFQGGRLKAQAEIAEYTAEQAYWAYRENLLQAVTEVDNALGLEKSLKAQEGHLADAYQSAQRSANTYEKRYRNGLSNIIDLLTVQQSTFDMQEAYLQATYDRLMNRIDLGLSLGLGVRT